MLKQSWHDLDTMLAVFKTLSCDNFASIWNTQTIIDDISKRQSFSDYEIRFQELLAHRKLFFVGDDIVLNKKIKDLT